VEVSFSTSTSGRRIAQAQALGKLRKKEAREYSDRQNAAEAQGGGFGSLAEISAMR
jgi:hypothetical protein